MAETMRINDRMKRCIEAFKATAGKQSWINDMSDSEVINAICCEWVRQNYTHREADEILK